MLYLKHESRRGSEHIAPLRRAFCGVAHAALFGSMARGDDRPDSDVDILVEFDPDAHVTVFDYVGVKEYIASLFLQPVDVIDREALKPHLRRPSARDAVYAF